MSSDLSSLAELMLPALENEMRTVLRYDSVAPEPFFGMLHYQMGWVDAAIQPVQQQAGKRIRPLVCMLAADAAGADWRQAVPAAAAIEILHNFSLVHDDIEDVSPTRRGRPTVWKIWGEAQAINSGDAMFTLAHLALGRLLNQGVPPPTVLQAFCRFDETSLRLTEGQFADMAFETREAIGVDEYIEMITGKTAVLLSLSAELGALVASVPYEVREHFAAFGLNLGLAFQVIDDILGIWGDETRTGKSAATDITTKKKTLPVLYGLQECDALRTIYRDNNADQEFVSTVVQLLDDVGARDFASEYAAIYSTSALDHLEAVSTDGQASNALFQLVDMLLNRDM